VSSRKKQLEDAKKKLLQRKEELQQILTNLSQENLGDEGDVQDAGDQAMTSSMESLMSSYQQNEAVEYERIIKALEAIENGTYGICIDCENDISDKRLKYYPNASRCMPCQEAFEAR
jgi:DnaK suppressor protein